MLLEIHLDRYQLLRRAQICDFPDIHRQAPGFAVTPTIDELLNVLLSQRTTYYQALRPIRKIERCFEFPAIYTHPADRFGLLRNLVQPALAVVVIPPFARKIGIFILQKCGKLVPCILRVAQVVHQYLVVRIFGFVVQTRLFHRMLPKRG